MRRIREREQERSPARSYWHDLVRRVHETSGNVSCLPDAEKKYFATQCLLLEVYNGGFEQFFSNSSGDLYELALDALLELDAPQSAALLVTAKELMFGLAPVPTDRAQRNEAMSVEDRALSVDMRLAELDDAFCADPDRLDERCRAYASRHHLFRDE